MPPLEPQYVVSHEHRFVYAVIQKAACSSVKSALAPLLGVDPEAHERPDGTSAIHRALRRSGHQIGRPEFLAGDYAGYFKFAFARNPYDRLLSCYLQKVAFGGRGTLHPHDYPGAPIRADMPFPEFALAVSRIPDRDANPHYRSQCATLLDEDGGLIPDYVGSFENLTEDLSHVLEKLGVADRTGPLPHLTRSPGRREGYYDESTRAVVAERFARDFEVLGYPT